MRLLEPSDDGCTVYGRMPVDFETAKRNLIGFLQSLPRSSVKFMFFLAGDLTHPKVCDSLCSVDVRGTRFYLTPGMTNNYCYAYSKGFIQYVVTPVALVASTPPSGSQPRPPLPSVSIPRILVEHGRHLDFGVIRMRSGIAVIKSHETNYTELLDGTFDRSMNACNFKLENVLSALSSQTAHDAFGQCLCETAPVRTTLRDVYDDAHAGMLRLLCSRVAGMAFSGGGWKRAGPKGRVRATRGGATNSVFLTESFVRFVSERLLQRIAGLRPDLEAVRLFYDDATEVDEVAPGSSANIVVWYDFQHNMSSMFQLDAATAFDAYAASAIVPTARTIEQARCLERFDAMERAVVQAVTVA